MPKFPYPRGVENELAVLFGLDRQGRAARNLGLSSITRGEGSLDLYETDDGPVTHRYGDQPDGSFGIGITHRGAFWNVSDLIGAGEDRDDGQDGRMDGHAGRIGAAEGRLDGAEGRLDSHASRLGSAEGRLDTHAGRIGAAEGRLDGHDSTLSSHNTRITNAQARANAAHANAATAQARADAAYSLAQDAASPQMIQNLQDYVEALNEHRQQKEAQLEARIAVLEAWRASLPQG